jgi:uncharacterized glyoxalase superfamily protein PhnB
MDTTRTATVWPVLIYDDARAAIRFLVDAFGFEETAVYAADDDESRVVHAELRWPSGGGVMLGSSGAGQEPFSSLPRGTANIYVVADEPDALFKQATAAGAEVVRELRDEDYGSRGFTVRDPEGNLWSFGTYAGE